MAGNYPHKNDDRNAADSYPDMNKGRINAADEDTMKILMDRRRKKRRILIAAAAAVILIAIIATVFGIRTVRDKKYNDQIAIADKALIEGNYEEAEAAYLAAIDIDPGKTRGREGNAYVLALTDRPDEAAEIYSSLYADTGESKYDEASADLRNGFMPSDPSLIPAAGKWREIDINKVPFPEVLTETLGDMVNLHIGPKPAFTIDNPENVNLIEDIFWSNGRLFSYAGIDVGMTNDYYSEPDPEGLAQYYESSGYFYGVADYNDIKELTEILFNIPQDKLDEILGEGRSGLYRNGDRVYFTNVIPTDFEFMETNIFRIHTDGEKYLIEYEAGIKEYDEWTGKWAYNRNSDSYGIYYAMMTLKKSDDYIAWSLLYNGEDMPDEYLDAMEEQLSGQNSSGNDAGSAMKIFGDIDEYSFYFTSGAGAWSTELKISEDGSFEGSWHDSEFESGSGYDTSVYESHFSGKFSSPERIDQYTYEFRIESLEYEGNEGDERIEDRLKHVTMYSAYGLAADDKNPSGETVRLYLPGRSVSDFSEEMMMWLNAHNEDDYLPILRVPLVSNTAAETVFIGVTQ